MAKAIYGIKNNLLINVQTSEIKKEATNYGYFFYYKVYFLKDYFEKRAFTKHLLILHQILHLLRYYNCIENDQQE